MKVKISIDKVSAVQKPSGKEIVNTKYRTVKNWIEIELETLADLNGNKGHAIIPAHLEGGISAANCIGMQVVALDFDDGVTFDEIKSKCEEIGLDITYAYHTFSSTKEKEKFRVVFVSEEIIEDPFIISVMLQMFQKIFPECDHSCKNMDRMFFGGKELIYYNEFARIALVQLLPPLMEALDTEKHFAKNMKNFASKAKIPVLDGHLGMGKLDYIDAILGENVDTTVIHITGESTNSPFFIAERGLHQSNTCHKEKKRRLEIELENTACQLYDDFKAGKDIGHEGKFALATNLRCINGGIKRFLESIEKTYGDAELEKWKKDIKYMKGYRPVRCSDTFCPYYGCCENAGTIIDTLSLDRRIYQKEENYVQIREAEAILERNLKEAFRSNYAGIHLIKAQTGLGKTTAYIKLIEENPGCKFLVALPTNKLKEEVYQKLSYVIPKEKLLMTASVYNNTFIPEEIQEKISINHSCGIHDKTGEFIKEFYEEIKDNPDKRAVAEECVRILKGVKEADDVDIVITTHAYFANMQEGFLKNRTIIIDEDFLQLQVFNRINSISMCCLKELVEKKIPAYSEIAATMTNAEMGKYMKICSGKYIEPLSEEQLEELEYFSTEDNINDLAYAGSFVRMIDRDSGEDVVKYFCPLDLPKMKYIILSATFNENIYQMYFVKKMEVYTYAEGKAAYRGSLQQYTYHSLGRKDLLEKKQIFSIARKMAGNPQLEIITFKKFEKMEGMGQMNSAGIHFGNSTGLNKLSGRDLAVIGTPYRVEEYYKLIACYLGEEVNRKEDRRPVFRRVEYKGSSFLITTYKAPILREVQLYSIESELEQCIGRARLLRKSCTVYVFSSFPCEQAQLHMKNYL